MPTHRISVNSWNILPEKEQEFNEWYDTVHTPHLFAQGAANVLLVRRFEIVQREMPEPLRKFSLWQGQPKHLILIERKEPPEGASDAPQRASAGQLDFARWLPYLRNASLLSYRCVRESTLKDYQRARNRVSLVRFDILPEKEQEFLSWYDDVHTPYLFPHGFLSVRRYEIVPRLMPEPLTEVSRWEGKPKHLVVLERVEPSPEADVTPQQPSEGQLDFARWLPYLRNVSLLGYRSVNEVTPEEFWTLQAIETYRVEHETWNMDRMMSIFADDATMILSGRPPARGKEAIRAIISEWASRPAERVMRHLHVVVKGGEAAAEWETTGKNADGTDYYRAGINVYQVENGKIKYIRLYST